MHRSTDVCFHEPSGEDRSHEIWREEAGLVVTPDARQAAVIDLNSGPAGHLVNLTVVVPTRNEAESVATLLEGLGPAVEPLGAEIIFVDDSDDDTPGALADCARAYSVPTRLLHRVPGGRTGGLSGAVIAGARQARGAWILVMDADLQHPPESAAALASTAIRHDADIVVGTRYAGQGSPGEGLGSASRMLVSSWATRLVKSWFPRRLAMVSDPLSGLFAFRASAIDLDRLNPVGFKILLEMLVRQPAARVAEVSYRFAPRQAGQSKASAREGLNFLRHLARLRWTRLARSLRQGPRTRREGITQTVRMVAFGLIGLSGLAVNTAALWVFYHHLGWDTAIGASVATQVSTAWNFALVDSIVYRNQAGGTRHGRALRFFVMNNLLLLARLPVLELLVASGLSVLWANALTLTMLFLVRFLVSDRAIFGSPGRDTARDPVRVLVDVSTRDVAGSRRPPTGDSAGRLRSRYLTYRYDLAGIVTIGSQIVLPELEFFRAQWVSEKDVDIAVRVGDVGGKGPRRRAAMTEYGNPTVVAYEEHLGRFGANFRAHLGDQISVEVAPLLARSPHVVYTNIVEALLRFVMVSRGRMLLHSACVELDGSGIMLSALTDTGKTGTVLRLLREQGARFLSDDMTVIDGDGNAYCFPKPLTISAHTVRAVSSDDLTRGEWRRLRFQSRLHSQGGRSFGVALSRFNLPIMSINALTQMLIPPPKYSADRLVTCQMTRSTRVRDLFIIERGRPGLTELARHIALQRLIDNTDDAYGFPPFRYLAPAITLGGKDYRQLRQAERTILANFLSHLRIRTLASDTFGWADEIPSLIRRPTSPANDVNNNSTGREAIGANGWPHWTGGLVYGGAG
jgi:dolichol-phosphate mannosyltransferase